MTKTLEPCKTHMEPCKTHSGIISAAKQAVCINQMTMHDTGPHPVPSFGC